MYSSVKRNVKAVKEVLVSEDILVFEFTSKHGKNFAVIYADGIVDKQLLGELVIKPLSCAKIEDSAETVKSMLAISEVKDGENLKSAVEEISDGNVALFIDGSSKFYILGLKSPPGRAVVEPPTQVAVKGPREGFTEDIKVNLGLVRKRIKTDKLRVKMLKVGEQSQTNVCICYIDGICVEGLPEKLERQILSKKLDVIPDSSYISALISGKPRSLFKRNATAEKPDVFCSKLSEGRVGVIVDGSPITLTVPYMIIEDFQSAEDYYASNYRTSIIRIIRIISVAVGVLLPAMYVAAQLFKIQLIPYKLLLKISGSVAGIPLSSGVEMFLILFVLEVLNEASIRMPKYVGMALSVVGALVLGETAVRAGIISTPSIIIVAFSAICLYVVPDLIETTSVLRWLFLIVSGSLGTFGIVLLIAFLISYVVSEQDYGTPLLAPFSPMIMRDLNDSAIRRNLFVLRERPEVFRLKNRRRMRDEQ